MIASALLAGAVALPAGAFAWAPAPPSAYPGPTGDEQPSPGSEAGIHADQAADEDAEEERLFSPLVPPLPPVTPAPDLSPMLDGRAPRADAEPLATRERPAAIVRIIVGLMALLALAYVSGHHRVQRFEERLGLYQVMTAGFPFVLLGLIARTPSVGILTDDVLSQLSPLLRLGLGWIGFMVGFRFDGGLVAMLPRRAPSLSAFLTLVPFTAVLAATGAVLALFQRLPQNLADPVFLRDAIILGTAGSMTAYSAVRLLAKGPEREEAERLIGGVLRLEELSGVIGLAFIAAYFRTQAPEASWRLPGTGWLLLTLGLGMGAGLLMYLLLRIVSGKSELIAVALGTIVFTAGFAGVLRLSPVVVCFVMGLLVGNTPGIPREELGGILSRLERPLYFLFLLIVGALWNVGEPLGWGLMLVFLVSRLAGKTLALRLARWRHGSLLSPPQQRLLAVAPLGPLSLAIVVNAQLLYPGGSISLIVTAILGGAIATEVIVQLSRRWWAPSDERPE